MNSILIFFSFLFGFFSNENPKLIVNIQNIQSLQGDILIGVYNSEEGFLGDETVIKEYKITVNKTTESFIITDLPIGNYAISLFHDENSDGVCNLNFIGIPKEPYGFSNNYKPKFSAPKFKDCKFSLLKNQELDIKLIN
ncbi:DUF2141 domain-containing protein [Xanthomarina sp. F2636L]|uniref:DUF2141 domain-containing protein n=1 Tax=Xanthomarina sp. F2636L TaxID=2996018 RepID=UPI00225DF005|nr:DUF2141 domain-containing protein [Xanthomarina sp. F2636L]MCX7551956.1 DUF2141 domain-containing protein [Xanthomarina sp. F2636L]